MEYMESMMNNRLEASMSEYEQMTDRIKELEIQLAEAKKDQARYQWLLKQFKMVSPDMGGNHTYQLPYRAHTLRGGDVSSIIDAAIASIQETGK